MLPEIRTSSTEICLSQSNIKSPLRQGRNTTKANFCVVCNAEARIVNYGALSCNSCKTFFRRHCLHLQDLRPCRNAGHCEITPSTRKYCGYCRLLKCFKMGMTTDLIRKEYQKSKDHSLVLCKNEPMSIAPIRSLDLLNNDRSLLTTNEWNLLSNVVHAYDRFDMTPATRYLLKCLSIAEPNIEICLSKSFDLLASFHSSVESLVSVTADFRIMTVTEQRSLFQRNLHGLFNMCTALILRETAMLEDNRCASFIINLYGDHILQQARNINKRLDIDSTLVKLILMVFAFSTNSYTVDYDPLMDRDALLFGTFRLFGSQNVYIEMLWKYMIYRYSYEEATLRFAALVKQMLDLMALSADNYTHNGNHRVLVNDFVEQAKGTLIHTERNFVPLWGKTVESVD